MSRSCQKNDRLHVVAAVLFDGGEILACRRKPTLVSGGLWEFPGGKVERGETPESALIREINEELSTSIEIDRELTTDVTFANDRNIHLTCFIATLLSARPARSTDHDRLLWVNPRKLDSLEWALPDIPAVRLLNSRTA